MYVASSHAMHGDAPMDPHPRNGRPYQMWHHPTSRLRRGSASPIAFHPQLPTYPSYACVWRTMIGARHASSCPSTKPYLGSSPIVPPHLVLGRPRCPWPLPNQTATPNQRLLDNAMAHRASGNRDQFLGNR